MTQCDAHPGEERWTLVLGASRYEVSSRGGWRKAAGQPLRVRPNNDNYPQVDYTRDDGKRITGRPLHTVILESFNRRTRPDGQEACHLDDNQWHLCWPENLRWDVPEGNVRDRMRNRPAAPPKPKRICVMCGRNPVTRGGKRCHGCVVWLGEQAADDLMNKDMSITQSAERLGYPSVEGLQRLAERYGGYGVPALPGDAVIERLGTAGGDGQSRWRLATLRDRLRAALGRGDAA